MKKIVLLLAAVCCAVSVSAGERRIASPDGRLEVVVSDDGGRATYSVTYDGEVFLKPSPLGLRTNVGDFTQGLTLGEEELHLLAERFALRLLRSDFRCCFSQHLFVRVERQRSRKAIQNCRMSVQFS